MIVQLDWLLQCVVSFRNAFEMVSLVGAFRRKTQTIVVTSFFFKTNELTDFINFISWY